ncbi:DUF475 domain-containing membrane protein [Campylobacter blaseri]|uniref:DUF475 domain-containing protein n=1 Tax=Campylobacter blaseri TaxID=2042961 RepID=A0A2P8R3R7_9BACT|nr:DUF475 domain-containing protein [Campylobacter blaseri]PSM53150.1 hypothetical protein CQ405_00975 [Campylobacter blaseri]PSM54616.1 hypothetical protein CRN67_00975 [Campylobacter blaseri]QKF86908.1 DUF475 domain-containing membrane protein [Campylobacter blaseri]
MKYFYSSFIITIIGLVVAFYLGGISAVYICFLLCVLEVSLSFDNAVVNAKVLNGMSKIWQDRFIIFGIPIAVFGMRFIFPLLIVSIASGYGMLQTLNFAITEPEKYHAVLDAHKNEIYIFGGAFLIMVFFDFFFNKDKDVYWIKIIENNVLINFLKNIPNISTILALILGLYIISLTKNTTYTTAYFSAILVHIIISSLNERFSANGVRSGLMGFLYLEVLDASFSFDGVIGAFALSENIFIIMIGLGIGAMFVRSITIYLVEKKTLTQFAYLEHGAHYAILALAIIMFIKVFYEVSEILTGTIGFGFIFLAFLCSVYKNKKTS